MTFILFNKNYKIKKFEELNEPVGMIEYAISNNRLNDVNIIVPTGKIVRRIQQDTNRMIYSKFGSPAAELKIYTLQSFVLQCFSKMFPKSSYKMISDSYRLALIEEAAGMSDLKFFKKNTAKMPHVILRRLSDIIYGLKEDGITSEALAEDIDSYEFGKPDITDIKRLSDISTLYNMYQALLGKKYIDFPEALRKLNKALYPVNETNESIQYSLADLAQDGNWFESNDNLSKIFSGEQIILIHGFSEFKQPEIEFLSHLEKSNAAVAINIDYSNKNGPLFGNLIEIVGKLAQNGYQINSFEKAKQSELIKKAQNDVNSNRPVYLRRWLFNTDEPAMNNSFSDIVTIIAAENRFDEVSTIAKIIKRLAVRESVLLKDICVVLRQPQHYSSLFRDVFSMYSLPANISDRFALSESPAVVAIFAVLDMIIYGYRRDDVNRALQSGYVDFSSSGANPVDAGNLYDTAIKLKIQGGRKQFGAKKWLSRLEGIIKIIENRVSAASKNDSEDPMELFKVTKDLEKYKKAFDDFKLISSMFRYNQSKFSPVEFSQFVKNNILRKLNIKQSIEAGYHRIYAKRNELTSEEYIRLLESVERDSRAFTAFIEILDEMTFIINDRNLIKKFTLEEITSKLKTAVSAAKYQIREKQNYGVTITSIEQTRAIPFKYMFLCGAIDGEFPTAYTAESLLGKELPETERRHQNSEMMQFYQFLTNAPELLESSKKRIFITYPKNLENGETVRSPFIDALLKITSLEHDGCVLDLQNLRNLINNGDISVLEKYEWLGSITGRSELMAFIGESSKEVNSHTEFPNINDIALASAFQRKWNSLSDYILNYLNKYSKIKNGYVDKTNLIEGIRDILTKRQSDPVSISELETYSACPYKYFAQRILKLEEKQPEDVMLSPLETGNTLHLILYRFYRSFQKNNSFEPVYLNPDNFPEYSQRLKQIADEEIEYIKFDHPYFELERESLLENLELWLKGELGRISAGWSFAPAAFELAFGIARSPRFNNTSATKEKKDINNSSVSFPEKEDNTDKQLNLSYIDISENLKLKGKIDRLELNQSDKQFLIADYKTTLNNIPGNKQIEKGLSFQMPLYLAAAEKILNEKLNLPNTAAGGVYYAFKPNFNKDKKSFEQHRFIMLPKEVNLPSPDARSTSIVLKSFEQFEQMKENSIQMAEKNLEKIGAGEFFVEPTDKSKCKYCKYFPVCRIRSKNPACDEETDESVLDE